MRRGFGRHGNSRPGSSPRHAHIVHAELDCGLLVLREMVIAPFTPRSSPELVWQHTSPQIEKSLLLFHLGSPCGTPTRWVRRVHFLTSMVHVFAPPFDAIRASSLVRQVGQLVFRHFCLAGKLSVVHVLLFAVLLIRVRILARSTLLDQLFFGLAYISAASRSASRATPPPALSAPSSAQIHKGPTV